MGWIFQACLEAKLPGRVVTYDSLKTEFGRNAVTAGA
jgi:hypothetical protein